MADYAGVMGYEVEVKYRAVDPLRLRQRLIQRGAEADPEVIQEDVYLRHPCRDFAASREALRLRRIGEANRITYKGPRHPGPTKTRTEIEVGLEAGPAGFEQVARVFALLGFSPVATIRKRRTTFHLVEPPHRFEIALDGAEGLGEFVEIEVLVPGESDLPAAQAAVLALAAELGLTELEPRSYLRMFLEAKGSERPGDGGPAAVADSGRPSDQPQTG